MREMITTDLPCLAGKKTEGGRGQPSLRQNVCPHSFSAKSLHQNALYRLRGTPGGVR
jgi:hypothetical protein